MERDFEKSLCLGSGVPFLFLLLLITIPNGFILFVLYRNPLHCFRKPFSVFLFFIAAVNFFNGIVVCSGETLVRFHCAFEDGRITQEGDIIMVLEYYHFPSTLKRDDFFAYVYFSNVTVSQTSVSSGPMKMRCFGRETNNVCQTTVACFVYVFGRFSSFRLYFSSYNLLIGWQVLGFQILSRITQMAPVQIKVVYDYFSAKRTTPFFITEEELLNLDFHSFKSRLLLEFPASRGPFSFVFAELTDGTKRDLCHGSK